MPIKNVFNIFKKMKAERKVIRGEIAVKNKSASAVNKIYDPVTQANLAKYKGAQSLVGGGINKPVAPAKATSTWKSKAPASTYKENRYTQAEKYEMIKKRRAQGPH